MTNQPTTAQLRAGGMSAGGTEPGAVYRFVPCSQDRHTDCPEVGPPNSADSPVMGEADVCECECHDDPPAARQIRACHRYAFRSGEWADLLSTMQHTNGRECYAVRFNDGVSDFWPVDDTTAQYEFRVEVPDGT